MNFNIIKSSKCQKIPWYSKRVKKIFGFPYLRMSDKPYITKELKILDRQRKREYRKHGKSNNYIRLNLRYNQKLESAASEYLNKNVRAISESEPGRAYGILKRLGAQHGELMDAGNFQIEEHSKLGLSAAQSSDRFAQNFAQISQEYPPLRIESLHTRVIQKIANSQFKEKTL